MKFSVLVGLAGLAFAAGTAPLAAAELPLPLKAAPPVAAPPPSWSGWFLGANVGVGTGHQQFYDIDPQPDYALDADSTLRGWVGGFQAGYNYQINWLVLGVAGAFDWTGVKNNFSCFSFGNQQCSADNEWIATLTGRVGAVVGSALVYLDGGAAWTRDTVTDVATTPGASGGIPAVVGDQFVGSQIRAGWTVGGGVEYQLSGPWSVGVEYDYLNFGEGTNTLNDGAGNSFPEAVKQQVQLVKAGFNYRFAGAGMASAPPAPGLQSDEEAAAATMRAFSVFDVGKDSFDGLVGSLLALSQDIDTSGPRLWISGGAGLYHFNAAGGPVRGLYSTGDVLGGYGFEGNNYELNLLAGLSAENDMLSQVDPTDAVHGTAVGVKVRGDTWINPTPQTLVYGEGEYSTAFQTYYTSAKYGFDITNGKQIFVGPEVAAFGDARFDQWRVGGHITQLQFGRIDADISAGYAHDSVVGNGAYSHLELSTNF